MTEKAEQKKELRDRILCAGLIAAVVGYIVLLVLVFVAPQVALNAGLLMMLPTPLYMAWYRGRSKEDAGPGCMVVGLLLIAGLVLIGLVALFQQEVFQSSWVMNCSPR